LKTKKKFRRFGLLDGILCVAAVLAIAAASCYFLAADSSAAARYTVAADDTATVSLAKASLTGTETEISSPEINRLLQQKLSASSSAVQQILMKPSGTANEVEFCVTARAKGHSWVVSGKGTLLAKSESDTVTAFVFSPEQIRLGKLPIPKNLFFSFLNQEQLPDGITAADGKLTFSASLVPASLSAFRVSEKAFVFRPKGPLNQLMDRIDDFAKKTPGEQDQAWNELKQQISEQAEKALAQGSDAFEKFKETIQEKYSSLDTDQIFSGVESGLKEASGKAQDYIDKNGKQIASAVQNFLDALRSSTSSQ